MIQGLMTTRIALRVESFEHQINVSIPWFSVIDVTVNPPITKADATGRYCNCIVDK